VARGVQLVREERVEGVKEPIYLQWPQHKLWAAPTYQRAMLDSDAPTGKYSPNATVNIGSNT
jgi:hypothetical protein